MYDRLPAPGKENRVRITQDDGQVVEGVLAYADDATQAGSAYCKANVLPDGVCNLIGLPTTSEPVDMFNVLSHVGDLHMWRRTVDGVVDYPVSTNRNAYQEWNDAKPAWYTLGDKITGTFAFGAYKQNTPAYAMYMYSDSITVSHDGTFDLSNPASIITDLSNGGASNCNNTLRGKFVKKINDVYTYFDKNKIYFIPNDATFTFQFNSSGLEYQKINVDKYQTVTGHAAIPASTTIEYLGNLGDKVRMQIVSYVGTGTYGASNPVRVTFDFEPKLVIIHGWMGYDTGTGYYSEDATAVIPYNSAKATLNLASSSSLNMNIVWDGKTVSWYDDRKAGLQANRSGEKYIVAAIG